MTPEQAAAANRPSVERKEQKRLEAEQRQARSRQRKGQQQIVHRLEQQIQTLEERQRQLTAELEKPETYETAGRALQINRELMSVQRELEVLTPEWETAATKLSEMDRAIP